MWRSCGAKKGSRVSFIFRCPLPHTDACVSSLIRSTQARGPVVAKDKTHTHTKKKKTGGETPLSLAPKPTTPLTLGLTSCFHFHTHTHTRTPSLFTSRHSPARCAGWRGCPDQHKGGAAPAPRRRARHRARRAHHPPSWGPCPGTRPQAASWAPCRRVGGRPGGRPGRGRAPRRHARPRSRRAVPRPRGRGGSCRSRCHPGSERKKGGGGEKSGESVDTKTTNQPTFFPTLTKLTRSRSASTFSGCLDRICLTT